MTPDEIRKLTTRGPSDVPQAIFEVLREATAQLAELNETLYNALNGDRITRIQVEPGQWPIQVEQKR